MVIKLITHPHPFETLQARLDFAEVQGVEIVENPWWYRNTDTGMLFYDLVACIGWPDEVSAKGEGQPGYAAIIGIVRPDDAEAARFDARQAEFYVLEEYQQMDVPRLLAHCVEMRKRWGHRLNGDLLSAWYGDPERFMTALALKNEELIRMGGEDNALMIAPPDDYSLKNRFEIYLRALKSVMQKDNLRLYLGKAEALKARLREFGQDDPAVMAVGGLIHTLLGRTMWMGHRQDDNSFNLRGDV
jgi:GNAT superfamily N-acetyltransferase